MNQSIYTHCPRQAGLLRVLLLTIVALWAALPATADDWSQLPEEERAILQRAGLNSDEHSWNVGISDGHVTSVDLTYSGLTELPFCLLELPYVERIDLYSNDISGDIGELTTAYLQTAPTIGQRLRYLSIEANQLTGDIGPLVALLDQLPEITTLYAASNHIGSISVMPEKEDLYIGLDNQQLDLQVEYDPSRQTLQQLMELMPDVTRYDPWLHSKSTDFYTIYCYDDEGSALSIYESYESFSVWTREGIRLHDGQVFEATCGNARIRVGIHFNKGDADFNGTIDERDVERTADYIARGSNGSWFNHTAADLNDDGEVDLTDFTQMRHTVAQNEPSPYTSKGDNTLQIESLLVNSEQKRLPILISNADNIVAVQFDITVPSGVWLSDWGFNDEGRLTGDYRFHLNFVRYDEEDNRTFRVLAFNYTGENLLEGNNGQAFALTLERDAVVGASQFPITVSNVVFATNDAQNVFTRADLGTLSFDYEADDTEWALLQRANLMQQTSEGLVPFWDFAGGPSTVNTLEGVVVEDGHIVELNLNGQRLTGSFPFALTELPHLRKLYIYSNPLSGNIGAQVEAYRETNPTVSQVLTDIDIDHCNFTGNIGTLVDLYPSLQLLDASDNQLTDISPLPASATVYLNDQRLDSLTFDLNTAAMTTQEFLQQLPDVLRYNYSNRQLSDNMHLYIFDADRHNVLDVVTNDDSTFTTWSGGVFIPNDSVYRATVSNGSFNVRIHFTEGDANNDGHIDIADVQALARSIGYNNFIGWGYANPTPSDLVKDEQLNVLDLVKLVDMLLDRQPEAVPAPSNAARSLAPATAQATLYCRDGQLLVSTTEPIAAMDLLLADCDAFELSEAIQAAGLVCATRRQGSELHLIVYSTCGQTLPAGETAIARTGNCRLKDAALVNAEAERIGVTAAGAIATSLKPMRLAEQPDGYDLRMGNNRGLRIDSEGKKTLYRK